MALLKYCMLGLAFAIRLTAVSAAPIDDRLTADLSTRPPLRFRLAIENASKSAEAIAAAYEWGNGLPRDPAAAIAWYRRAADTGDAAALVQIGIMMEQGAGTPRDPAAAAVLYRQAAGSGEVEALVRLGMLYEWGRGVPRDRCGAAEFYRDAATRGHPSAGLFLVLLQPAGACDPVS